jgi:hypothetical protein
MNAIWVIAKIVVYTAVLNVIYRQSYNLLFFLAQRPKTWIAVAGIIGFLNIGLVYSLGWDPRIVGTATLVVAVLNSAPTTPKGVTKEEMRALVDEVYREWGTPHGRLQARLGLASFVVCSIVAYVLFFGEVCDVNNICKPLWGALT